MTPAAAAVRVGDPFTGDRQPPDLGVLRPSAPGQGEVVERDPASRDVQRVVAHRVADRIHDGPLDRHEAGLAGGEPAGLAPEDAGVEPCTAEQEVVDPVGGRGRVEVRLAPERAGVGEVLPERPPGLGNIVGVDFGGVEDERRRRGGGTGDGVDRFCHHDGRHHPTPSSRPPGLSTSGVESRSGGRRAAKSAGNRKDAGGVPGGRTGPATWPTVVARCHRPPRPRPARRRDHRQGTALTG